VTGCSEQDIKFSGAGQWAEFHDYLTYYRPAKKDISVVLVLKKAYENWNILSSYYRKVRNEDSVVGIVTGYGLDDRGIGVRVPVGSRFFSLFRVVQTGSGVHSAYPMGTSGCLHGG
jgi:hypothetical protein